MNNTNEIKFKSSKLTVVVGLLLLFIAAIFEIVIIQGFREDGTDGLIATIVLTICFTGSLALCGIYGICAYFATGKTIRKALERYGKEYLISHINQSTIRTFHNPLGSGTVYFTDRFVIDPREAVIDYNEISMIYKSVRKTRYANVPGIAFVLYNGNTHILCDNVKDADIMNLMQLCYQHNTKILLGFTKENQEKHKERVKAYKSGDCDSVQHSLNGEEKKQNKGANDNKRYEVRAYIAQNYIPAQKADAIIYYQAMTGVSFSAAEAAVEDIFAIREQKGMILPTPKEWTPDGKKYSAGKAMVFMGTFMLVVAVMFAITMPLIMNADIDRQVNAVSAKEREALLDAGYHEYKTQGNYVKRILNYKLGDKADKYSGKTVFIFELEDETYLGIASKNGWYTFNGSVCTGFDIFYDGELERALIEREDGSYDVQMIAIDHVVAVGGIASEDSLADKKLNVLITVIVFTPMLIVGLVLLLKGRSQAKKYA